LAQDSRSLRAYREMQDGREGPLKLYHQRGPLLARSELGRQHDAVHKGADGFSDLQVLGRVSQPFHQIAYLLALDLGHAGVKAHEGRGRGGGELDLELLATRVEGDRAVLDLLAWHHS
jgi:hypothetical protein